MLFFYSGLSGFLVPVRRMGTYSALRCRLFFSALPLNSCQKKQENQVAVFIDE
jgi:hypothetical protein